jgi:MFS family permease
MTNHGRPLASTIISSATPDVMHTFNSTNETLGAFVTSVYLLGYVAGPLLLAPLSETHGRAVVYNVCNFIFLVFNIACALANSLGSLIAFRFFAGIAASCPITLGMGTVADLVRLESRGKVTGLLFLGPLLGPTAAPLSKCF